MHSITKDTIFEAMYILSKKVIDLTNITDISAIHCLDARGVRIVYLPQTAV